MKRILFLLFVLAISLSPELFAQSEVSYERGATQAESILPPSPEAASVVKYAGVPFTHSLGAAEYDVPIYELKGRQLQIPISLSYRSNGIRVDEIAGVAGLGWTLNAGGCITREVVYMPDEYSNWNFYTRPSNQLLSYLDNLTWNISTELFLERTMSHTQDVSADRYSYSVDGLSGTFIITPSKEIVQLTGVGVVIEKYQNEGLNGPISAFKITGPDGTVYYFDDLEVSTRKNQKVVPTPIGSGPNIEWSATTAWYLTSITSADQTETATLSYSNGGIWDRSVRDYAKGLSYSTVNGYYDSEQGTTYHFSGGYVESTCSTRVLSSISLRGTVVSFNYSSQNTSTLHKAGSRVPLNNYPKRLSSINVTSPLDSSLVYFTINTVREPNDGRIILSGINQYNGSELTDRWSFTYKTLPYNIYRYSQDWFGFYNKENIDDAVSLFIYNPGNGTGLDGGYTNIGSGADLGLGFDPENGGSGGSGQNNDDFRPRGNLSPYKIDNSISTGSIVLAYGYPVSEHADYMSLMEANHDGARTVFDYEGAYIGHDGNHQITLGVRVKTIKVYDGNSLIQCRSFTYANPSVDGVDYPYYHDYVTLTATEGTKETGQTSQPTVLWEYTIHESSSSSGVSTMTSRVLYGLVSEKILPSLQDTIGVRTVYTYDNSSSVRTEHHVGSRTPAYADSVFTLHTAFGPSGTIKSSYISNEAPLPGLLSRKDSYRVNSAGTEELYESVEYSYKHFGAELKLVDYTVTELLIDGVLIGNIGPGRVHHYPIYATRVYGESPSAVLKIGYHSSGNDSTVVNYDYVSRHTMEKPVRKASAWVSGSDVIRRVSYEYPDTTNVSGAWVNALTQRHSLLEPIIQSYQRIVEADTVYRLDIETEYDWFTSGISSKLQQKAKRERLNGLERWNETVLSRDEYGNITAIKERGKPLMQIQWGYNGLYPTSITEGSGSPALTSSYTWSPGIGLLQETSPNGVSTYYEYDDARRLYRIKNTQGITKEQYEYGLLNNGDNLRYVLKKSFGGTNGNDFISDKTWWNTLGLKRQSVSTSASGNGQDLVYSWDSDYLFHDDVFAWLPFPVDSWNDSFIDNADSLAAVFHGSADAYEFKGYEQSLRDKQTTSSYPGYHDYPSYETENVRTGYPRYCWTDNGIMQEGIYHDHEVIATTNTDADGRNRTTIRDRFGNTLGTEYGQGTTSSTYIYDREGRLRAVAGGNIALTDTLNMWRYSYDDLGRIKSKGIPGSIREFYTYDNEDRVVSKIIGDEITTIGYDVLGRIVTIHLNKGLGPRSLIEQHWYDTRPSQASALLSTMTPAYSGAIVECGLSGMETFSQQALFDENGLVSGIAFSAYSYDKEGRNSRIVTMRNGSNTVMYSEEYRYDFRGNPINSAYKSGHSSTGWDVLKTETDYDLRDRPVRIESWLNLHGTIVARDTTYCTYDNLGRPWKTIASSGGPSVITENTYTLQGFLSRRSISIGEEELFREQLRYDTPTITGFPSSHAGLITEQEINWTAPHDINSFGLSYLNTLAYKYDEAARVIKTGGFTGIPIGEPTISGEILSYDNCSNIVSRSNYNGLLLSMGGETYYYNGHQLEQKVKTTGGFSPSITTYLYDHDNRGRMISDGSANTQITYNHMNLPAKVRVNNVSLANYSYLADGTKICSMNDQGEGLVYCGPMIYRRNNTGALSFDGVSICSGRITSAGVRYNVTDHLGSVRGVIRGSDGALLECNNYALYGGVSSGPLNVTTNTESCRYHFSGKEDQSIDFSVPYTDFGARHYSPALRRWLVPDPKSEDYYEISPYAYCAGDPVNLLDDDGKKPRVYIQKSRIGHAFITTGEGNQTIIYTYGRYGSLTPSSSGSTLGGYTPRGEGVLYIKTGQKASEYLKSVRDEGNYSIYSITEGNDAKIDDYFNGLFDNGTRPSDPNKPSFNDSTARVIDTYHLLKNNCVTTTQSALREGGVSISPKTIRPVNFDSVMNSLSVYNNDIEKVEDVEAFINELISQLNSQ